MSILLWISQSLGRCASPPYIMTLTLNTAVQFLTLKVILTSTLYALTLLISSASPAAAERVRTVHKPNPEMRCGGDLYEPNDRRYKARNISNELNARREVSAQLCAQDRDWYTVWLNRGELVELHVTTSLERPPHIKVFAPRKRKPSGIMRRVSPSHRRVRVYAKSSGRYRVLVSGSEDAQTRYQLSLKRPTRYGL